MRIRPDLEPKDYFWDAFNNLLWIGLCFAPLQRIAYKAEMKKNTIKYFVDVTLFVDMCSIAMIGLLLAFIIPDGRTGRGAKYFLGLHRHDWGDIHLYLSILLLLLLIFHLWFNWTWIVQSSKKYFGRNWKNAMWCISGAWIVVLAVACILIRIG